MESLSSIEQALLLLIVGMGTVFIILILIIQLSKLLIIAVNKFAPAEVPRKQVDTPAASNINPNVAEAIRKAVSQVASGAKVVDIKKL